MLLKFFVYGYLENCFSSRKLEKADMSAPWDNPWKQVGKALEKLQPDSYLAVSGQELHSLPIGCWL